MSALVSFERVFEVLDLEPLIKDKPDAGPRAGRAGVGRVRRTSASRYPSADKVSLASLEEVAKLDTRGGVEVLHDVSFRAEPGQMVALVGSSGAGQVDDRAARAAPVRRRLRARCGWPGSTSAT